MKPDALRMLARQLRRDPNPDAIEDAACALEALAIERERPPEARTGAEGRFPVVYASLVRKTDETPLVSGRLKGRISR